MKKTLAQIVIRGLVVISINVYVTLIDPPFHALLKVLVASGDVKNPTDLTDDLRGSPPGLARTRCFGLYDNNKYMLPEPKVQTN